MRLDDSEKTLPIFERKANILHTGTSFGIVHPKHPKFAEQFKHLLEKTGQGSILAQKLGFNTEVTPIDNLSDLKIGQGMQGGEMLQIPNFYRTPEASDGVVVSLTGGTRLKIAVAIMNADCGVIEILAPNDEIAVLHGGFNNVDNPNGSSIVTNAIAYFKTQGFNPSQLKFRVGEAARACCYGFNTLDSTLTIRNEARAQRLRKKFGNDVTQTIENPPRKEGLGFDVPLIAARQAEILGVSDVETENLCTSCHGLSLPDMGETDTYGTWYSNLREGAGTIKTNGFGARNAVVVYPNY